MTRTLLLLTALSLSACMGNGQSQDSAMNWGNMYTHDVRITQLSQVQVQPLSKVKVKGKNLISPGIY